MNNSNDQNIIKELQNVETKDNAFKEIVKNNKEILYFTIRRIAIDHDDTNDILQETFLKAYTNINDFRFDSKISTWLYKIAINTTLNFLNTKYKKNTFSINSNYTQLAEKLEADSLFDGDELQKKLQKSILLLPPKQQLIFNLHYFDEMKYEEMSEILETSVGALKASYHIAVKKIEKVINEI